jgi:hypothetical protein
MTVSVCCDFACPEGFFFPGRNGKFLPPNEITPTSILWRPRYFVCFELCPVVAFVCPRNESNAL